MVGHIEFSVSKKTILTGRFLAKIEIFSSVIYKYVY